jgi:hypothetical protein
MERHVVVATHGHCFDGLCSAVMFTRLIRHLEPGVKHAFSYRACGYGPGQNGVDPAIMVGDVNAILDFRFSPMESLTWYFDHHVSAFVTPAERAAYEAKAALAERRFFHDAAYTSCTKLIADLGASRFGMDSSSVADMVRWADIIDSAAFASAQMAVERKEPELRLMTLVEHMGDDAFLTKLVGRLLVAPLGEVAASPDLVEAYAPFGRAHEEFVELVRGRAKESGGVVLVNLTDRLLDVAGKFVTYALYPRSAYSIVVTRSKTKCKLSIGYNPWSGVPRTHDIAAICERHGGGGHAVVGAISLSADRAAEATALAQSIATELAG